MSLFSFLSKALRSTVRKSKKVIRRVGKTARSVAGKTLNVAKSGVAGAKNLVGLKGGRRSENNSRNNNKSRSRNSRNRNSRELEIENMTGPRAHKTPINEHSYR